MQPPRPIDSNIALPPIQPRRPLHTPTRRNPTKLKQPIKHRTIIPDIILPLLLGKIVHIIRGDPLQEVDVLVGVELRHLVLGGGLGAVDLQLAVQAVVHDEAVGHADAVGFHGVAGVVGVVAHVAVVEVGDFFGLRVRAVGRGGGGVHAGDCGGGGHVESRECCERVGIDGGGIQWSSVLVDWGRSE